MKKIILSAITIISFFAVSVAIYASTLVTLANGGEGWTHSSPNGKSGDVVSTSFTYDNNGDATSYRIGCKMSSNVCFTIIGPTLIVSPITAPPGTEDSWDTGHE